MKKEKILKKIDKYDIISFDIFDTLIIRNCYLPSTVFDLVELKYNYRFENKCSNFKKSRINAEFIARKKNKNKEINLENIYSEIDSKYDKSNLMKIECEIEKEVCSINKDFIEIYEYALKKKKKIIITSDMYLFEDTIIEILKKNNIIYNDIYVSSSVNKKKSDGSIFKYLKNKYGKNILHFGDNYKSDYIMPKIHGLKSIHYKKNYFNKENIKILNDKIDYKLNKNNNDDIYINFGYQNLGPLMLGFVNYIETIRGKKKIFFLAREGKFIMQCYQKFMGNEFDKNYIYVSRKSITKYINEKNKNFHSLINSQSLCKNETVEMFLNRCGIDLKINSILLKKYNLDLKNDVKSNLFKLEKLWPEIKTDGKIDLFEKYLKQFDFNNDSLIVDIGWAGSMQDMIQNNYSEYSLINGCYLGVRKEKYNPYKYGYIYNPLYEKNEIKCRSFNGMFEMLMSADHGSTIDYIENEFVRPVLTKNDVPDEVLNKIKRIQEGVLNFIDDFKNDQEICNMNEETLSNNLIKVGLNPSKKIISMFKDFKMNDEQDIYLIEKLTSIKIFTDPIGFINSYIKSGWPNAFLKENVKIVLPYFGIYSFLYKLDKKKRC